MKSEIFKQVKSITQMLIKSGLIIDFNYPSINNELMVWERYQNFAFQLKSEPYSIVYNKILRTKDYNFVFIDGAIVQMQYSFKRSNITSHILRYYPSPNTESYQDAEDVYEETYYGNENFSDMIDSNIISFPVRFDFSNDQKSFIELEHPYSHFTMGNYANCRLPVSKPLSPNRFLDFLLRSFYFKIYKEKFDNDSFQCKILFDETITIKEKAVLHINYI